MPAPEEKPKSGRSALCMRCGRLVILDKFTLCYDCRRDEKQQVDKALDYLKDHRGATLQQIAMATGVDPQLVLKLIQGGRMESSAREKAFKKKKK